MAHATNSLASSRRLAVPLVGGKVERNEQQKVRAENADSSNSGELLSRAPAIVREPGPVGRSEIGPRSEVNEA